MLIDEVKIKIKAGNGGKGNVSFNKNMMSLGPTGGSGGKGGDVYFQGVSDIGVLAFFRNRKDIKANNGENGKPQYLDGSDGKDVVLNIPVGSVIENIDTGEIKEIVKTGEKIVIAKGGIGGKGNFHFRSSTNTSPTQFQKGLLGEEFNIRIELRLIADIGLVGLPNAGKSSLLNELTNADSRVGNYPFTTLEPSLGAYYGLIIADIPGLIEGASEGKGLGVKFLRHIERTNTIFHLVSSESDSPLQDYKKIEKELASYNKKLTEKEEYILLSKTDTISSKELTDKKILLQKATGKQVFGVSVYEKESLTQVKKILEVVKDKK